MKHSLTFVFLFFCLRLIAQTDKEKLVGDWKLYLKDKTSFEFLRLNSDGTGLKCFGQTINGKDTLLLNHITTLKITRWKVTKGKVILESNNTVIDGIEKGWAERWRSKNWYRTKTDKAINADLWERLLILISAQQKVTFNWVKGHAGHIENERCDELALGALSGDNLIVDNGYKPNNLTSDENGDGQNIQNNFRNLKVTVDGDPCRKCGVNVVKKPTKKKEIKPGQSYYYEYILVCPGCKTMYLTDEAKRDIVSRDNNLFG